MDASSSGARWRRWAAEPGAGVVGASGPEAGSRVLEGGSVANARPVLLLACRVGLSHKLEDEDVVQVGGCCSQAGPDCTGRLLAANMRTVQRAVSAAPAFAVISDTWPFPAPALYNHRL